MSAPRVSTSVVLAVTSGTAFLTIKGIPNLIRCHDFLKDYFSSQPVIIAASPTNVLKVRELMDNSDKSDEILVCQTLDPHFFAKALENYLPNYDAVVIHDASRPLSTRNQFDKVIGALTNDIDAVRPATPFTETLKILNTESIILGTLDRSSALRISTPELIRISAIDMNSSDSGWFLPLTKDVRIHHIDGEPQGMRINSESDRDLLELY
jgi:2-C-methyl-D-erythritol 4-phosphate cytidylyltransferase